MGIISNALKEKEEIKMKEMVRQWLVCLVTIGFSVLATADVVRLYPYPSDYIGRPAEGAMQWFLTECDYGYALTHIGRCHWIDHPSTNESGEVSHRWTYDYKTPTGHYTIQIRSVGMLERTITPWRSRVWVREPPCLRILIP